MPRIMTYNVHRCVGVDRKLDLARVAAVIAQARPDIVALQELDVGRRRTGGVDQAHALAARLGMAFHFNAAMRVEEEQYGDAVLAAGGLSLIKAGPLPGSKALRGLEPRGALLVEAEIGGRRLRVLNSHLGLVPHEQRAQAAALAGPEWLGRAREGTPTILLGDFNATPLQAPHRILARSMTDARLALGGAHAQPTFPSRLPVLPIDHVLLSAGLRVTGLHAFAVPLARTASDHLPLVVDFDFA
ncbi:MAG TPA: endonuclease/exonuclease/phosphatase family protein [Caulobacteraceae bacterium]|nr:endonuclease/exonuclease/phosphatase family protein [Caulobacteraceae bacterium]